MHSVDGVEFDVLAVWPGPAGVAWLGLSRFGEHVWFSFVDAVAAASD
jgi:hypothetical protein